MPDTRTYAVASLLLYQEGQGDPVVLDYGCAWLDQLEESRKFGRFGLDGNSFPQLEYIPGLGLTCRPYLRRKNTRIADWNTSGGGWEEQLTATGAPQVYELVQYQSTAGVSWSATSKFTIPQNPNFAFRLVLDDTPPDWDTTANPPYVRLEFGFGTKRWGVQMEKDGRAYLLDLGGGTGATELGNCPRGGGYQDGNEILVYVRCLRGQIGISVDGGQNYTFVGSLSQPVTVPSGSLTLRGQGGRVAFGLHQVLYQAGTFTSSTRNTFTNRTTPLVTLTPWGYTAAGGTIALTDLANHPNGVLQWKATLTPQGVGTTNPFEFYKAPVLFNVTYDVAPTLDLLSGAYFYDTPWDPYLISGEPDKPYELDGGSMTFRFSRAPWSLFTGNYRDRKVQLLLGHGLEDGTFEYTTAFTGYIQDVGLEYGETVGEVEVTMRCRNAAAHLKDHQWTALDLRHLGGMTANQAADYLLSRVGWSAANRSWHAVGDAFVLDPGSPTDPTWMLKKGESAWDMLVRIFGAAGLEVGVLDNGVVQTIPRDSYSSTVWVKRLAPLATSEVRDLVSSIRNHVDYSHAVTLVLVEGKGADGEQLLAYALDTAAESRTLAPLTGRFAPRRRVHQEEMSGTCTLGLLQSRAAALGVELFRLPVEPDLTFPVDLRMARRDQVEIHGGEGVGIPSGTRFFILTLRHSYQRGMALSELSTTVGLRRIG